MIRPIALLIVVLLLAPAAHAAPVVLAVPDIGFTDSSGEVRDQNADHHDRLVALTAGLRTDIAKDGNTSIIPLPCNQAPCALDEKGVAQLLEQAKQAGASLILVGNVHKMSTLVLSMRLAVLDVATGRVVMERLLSFRGDNDEGWRRAGEFVAKDVIATIEAPPK